VPTGATHFRGSVGLIWGELGVWAEDARYLTLHGGVSALGVDYVCMQQELAALGEGLSMAALQLDEARDEARLARSIAETLGSKFEELRHLGTSLRAFEVIYRKLQEAKAKRGYWSQRC
jgi:hypothetical protein